MNEKNESCYVLQELTKGIKMGMDSLSTISEKVGDASFRDELLYQYDTYNDILSRVENELKNHSNFPEELPTMQKVMGYFDIQTNTWNDKSNSNIAEMLMKGMNMGVIEGVKLKNQNPNIDNTIQVIIDDFIRFQENSMHKLKGFL